MRNFAGGPSVGFQIGIRRLIVYLVHRTGSPPLPAIELNRVHERAVICPWCQAFGYLFRLSNSLLGVFLHHVADQVDKIIADFFVEAPRMPRRFFQVT